jgi:hypothetical protein
MRALNDFEKDIIRRIVTQNHRDIVTLLDPYMLDKDIVLDYTTRTAIVHFDQAIYLPNNNYGANRLIDEVLTISDIIISIVGILDYLRQNNYLKLIQGAATPTPPRFGRLVQGHQSITYQIYDQEITELLLINAFKTIKVEQSLLDFVSDNFRTKDEIRHNENISWAKKAFIAAIIIGGLDLFVSSLDTYFDRAAYYSPTTIDTTQFNQLSRQLEIKKDCKANDNSLKFKIVNDFTKDTFNLKIDDGKKPSR